MPSEKDVISGANAGRAKILLMGPSKAGKTVCAVNTSPKPVFVILAEDGGLASAAQLGGKFDYEEVHSAKEIGAVMDRLYDECKGKKPKYATIVLDSLTAVAEDLEAECIKAYTGWDVYRAFKERFGGVVRDLLGLPAHSIAICHAVKDGSSDGDLGILPAIPGKSAAQVPAKFQDSLWLQVTASPDSKGEAKREFLLGPQGNWIHSGRNIQGIGRMPADITAFVNRFLR